MMNRWVLNASPIIVLSKSKLLRIISPLAETWLIPDGVVHEISIKSSIHSIISQLEAEAEVITRSVDKIDPVIIEWNLGLGESQVLSLALSEGTGVIIDDMQARKCAKVMDIPLNGSVGLILRAKKAGLIKDVRPAFQVIIESGLYVDSKLIENILKAIKEQ